MRHTHRGSRLHRRGHAAATSTKRSRASASPLLTFQDRKHHYRIVFHGTGKARYAVIQPLSHHNGKSFVGRALTDVTVAVGHALAHWGGAISGLARTGGGGIGRLVGAGGVPASVLLIALLLLTLGFLTRRFAYAVA